MFLYQKVFEDLKNKIENGSLLLGQLLPSEREISIEYEVDRTTVRKAIQLLADKGLVEKKPGKGTVVIHNLPTAKVVNKGKSILFLLPNNDCLSDRISVPFYAELFSNAEDECRKNGYTLIYSKLDEDKDLRSQIPINDVVGIIFLSKTNEAHIEQALDMQIPSILVNSVSNLITSIVSDNYSGEYQVASDLIEKGHRDIAVINGISTYNSAKERIRGIKDAMEAHGLKLDPRNVYSRNNWEYSAGIECVEEILNTRKKLPTAIICCNDRLAIGAVRALQSHGIKVPEDVSIAGYDNSTEAKINIPGITSIEINIPMMAKFSVSHLLYLIESNSVNMNVNVTIPIRYIERESIRSI